MLKAIVILISLLWCADSNVPKFKWTNDGVEVTSTITQDTVSRGTSGTGDIDFNATGVYASADGKSLTQRMDTKTTWENEWGSRLYLLNADGVNYEIVNLKNKEVSFDVNMSTLPCSINAALYTVEMPKSGDSKGAKYGTGYCDAQGSGSKQCSEMDLWEANSAATQLAVHSCSGGSCDTGGCNVNPYRSDKTFYGVGEKFALDTSKIFTVVTQFLTDSSGALSEVRRSYIQNGKTIPPPSVTAGGTSYDSITDPFCSATGASSLAGMNASLEKGHVIVISLWASDDTGGMDWLDAGDSGPCTPNDPQGARKQLVKAYPNALVVYSNLTIKTLGK